MLILKPPGRFATVSAAGTIAPSNMFFAPQTICSSSSPPASTWQMESLSASGCFLMETMRATTTLSSASPKTLKPSTAVPVMIKRWANSSGESSIST